VGQTIWCDSGEYRIAQIHQVVLSVFDISLDNVDDEDKPDDRGEIVQSVPRGVDRAKKIVQKHANRD
jgi:hypothetical protein